LLVPKLQLWNAVKKLLLHETGSQSFQTPLPSWSLTVIKLRYY
jgi:hypothetical protein